MHFTLQLVLQSVFLESLCICTFKSIFFILKDGSSFVHFILQSKLNSDNFFNTLIHISSLIILNFVYSIWCFRYVVVQKSDNTIY
jgi:hypothetical protein